MATDKKSFILYCDQRGTWERLSDEQAGKLIKHVISYVNDENPESDFVTELAFEGIKRALKSDLIKYEAIKAKRSEAGRRGGKQTQANQASATFAQANQAVSVNGNVNVNVNGNVNDIKKEETDLSLLDPFEKFWNLGLPRVEKRKCQNEWFKIDSPEYSKILEHVPKFVIASGQYLKNPLKYLEGRLWQDEDLPDYADKKGQPPKIERFIPTPPKL